MQANDYIFNNIEILCNIFQYLNYHEQLKLTSVCGTFQDVIVNFVWKRKFKQIEIMRTPTNFILTNRIYSLDLDLEILKQTRMILSDNEFDEFLNLNANNVEKVKFWLTRHLENKPKTYFHIKYKLLKLNSLTYVDEIITDNSFKMLSEFCPQLEHLCLEFCGNSARQSVKLGKDIKVEHIENIKTLKYLEVKDTTYNFLDEHCHTNSDILEILKKLKLLHIILRFPIMPDEYADAFEIWDIKDINRIFPCEILKLGPFCDTFSCAKVMKTYLNLSQNLTNLAVIGNRDRDSMGDNDFCDILSKSCGNLKSLELHYFTLTNLAWPQTINELIVHGCRGLTSQDLEYILGDLKLNAFTTIDTKYAGSLAHDCRTSNTLKHLEFDNPQIGELFELNKHEGFKNISSLVICHNFNFMLKHISTQCPNLRTLYLTENIVSLDELYKLKLLEKLVIEVARNEDLSNLLPILKHSTLSHFVIHKFQQNNNTYLYTRTMICRTNLVLLDIPINMFIYLKDFWLDLLNKNPQLHIKFLYHPTEVTPSFLRPLITDEKFPERLKTINIFGFDIDCQQLRNDFDVTLCHIIKLDPYLEYPLEQFYIIL